MPYRLYHLAVAVALLSVSAHPAAALAIDVTYGASVTGSAYAAQLEAGFGQVAARYESLFTNPITVAIDVEAMTGGLGQSVTSVLGPISYQAWRGSLATETGNTVAQEALASLPARGQPVGTGILLTTANARALGLYPPQGLVGGTAPDSVLSFNAAALDFSGSGAAGLFDFVSVASHELDEALGINSSLSGIADNGALPTSAFAEDEFRYTAPGVHSFSTNPALAVSFSLDGGTTDLARFNQINGFGDRNDWAFAGCMNADVQIQDAIACPGQVAPPIGPTSPEAQVLQALGYEIAVPEPASILILGGGVVGLVLRRRAVKAKRARVPPC